MDRTVPDATIVDALDREHAEEWREFTGTVDNGSVVDFLAAVNEAQPAQLPVEAQPHPFVGDQSVA